MNAVSIKIYSLFIIILIITAGCGEKMPLPVVQITPESFGANDTSYIHLNPDWNAAEIGYAAQSPFTPVDIAIGLDEYIFIADSANDKILALNKSGSIIKKFNLDKITPVKSPSGIDINDKLNLLIVNGTNKIYVWNQYFNNIGVDSLLLFSGQYPNGYFSGEASVIDSILAIHTFYTDDNPHTQFSAVAFGPAKENVVFLTDKGNNRIVELKLVFSTVAKLKNGFRHPAFKGLYSRDVARFGSGAGTVDNPRGITCDDDGNIYFTQLGGNFLVQKLKNKNGYYSPAFTLYEDPIMDLNRFKGPSDIALDMDNEIFVLDKADSGRVSKFHNRGVLSGSEADLGNEGLVMARFNGPNSIAVSDDGIVFIAHTQEHRIERFQYTISKEDLPDEER